MSKAIGGDQDYTSEQSPHAGGELTWPDTGGLDWDTHDRLGGPWEHE